MYSKAQSSKMEVSGTASMHDVFGDTLVVEPVNHFHGDLILGKSGTGALKEVSNGYAEVTERTLKTWRIWFTSDLRVVIASLSLFM